ncbi:DNA-directed RNA polymerase III subunit C34 NDAI_0G05030 [Naumovozyma dairenensis CBS 421]|uniref:DNA-directed RNA polymerase III subunit RPC6 n=1 Tax=Naumovozyma dairenensis (strain ATCC 10597 / BCRC 20456 / CBS 421 / NBRC 0211 / NRRL Y-12639) TaxID=1071378 RepID=J7S4J4_NAUDC|nr:hypothetical protein NDAI_0G05030 [Naumovozyma dairenensis CBS 421]CCK73486.1 hypothetical protein NDAI_0G05030 [Naumovozyma dairenensis CBS 421]
MSSTDLGLSDNAKTLHSGMIAKGSAAMFSQQELTILSGQSSLGDLMLIVQELLDKNLIKLIKQNNELKFQAVDYNEANKKSSMSSEEALVYSYIEASGREGIWSKTIKARTNLHQHVVLKCLKSLESQRYVKSVKSVKFPTRKIYMLYNLQPSIEVTGGPWFTEGELDVEFINSLLTIVWRFICGTTFPNGFKGFSNGMKEVHYSPMVKNYSTTSEILEFISGAGVSTVELHDNDIRSLCEVLVYDDKLEQVSHDCYKATLQSVLMLNAATNFGAVSKKSVNQEGGGDNNGNFGDIGDDDDDEFSIFSYFNGISQSQGDKEAVYFDEWTL